jgi:hypothetical protein
VIYVNELKNEYPYETAPIKRLVPLRHYDIGLDSFGGDLYPYAAELKNGLVLIVSNGFKTVGVGLDENNLKVIDMDLLKKVAKSNHIDFDWRKTTKEELIELMTA